MKSVAFLVAHFGCLVCLTVGHASGADNFQHSYAVVVGIDDYSSVHKGHLSYARNDAQAIAEYLRKQDFIVTALYDQQATKHNILSSIHSVAIKLGADDRVIVFMAGHGANERIGEQLWGYFIPYDGTDTASYLAFTELQDASLQMNAARHQLFIMDACFSGLMLKTRTGGVPPDVPNYIDEITRRITREALTAGGDTQEVLDTGPNGHSVFTSALLEGLNGEADLNGDGYITFAELESYIIPRASNRFQTPATGVLPGNGGGQFVFVSPLGRTTPLTTSEAIPKITVKRGDPDELARAKEMLGASRFSEAIPLFQQSSQNGNTEASFYMGIAYERGFGVKQDYAEAHEWFEKAALAGNPLAMNSLGFQYDTGQGVSVDYTEARRWFEKAAAAGIAGAIYNLGTLYERGQGVSLDYYQARQYFEKAAAVGSAEAMVSMGSLYYFGHGVSRDYARARLWFERAAEAGSAQGMAELGLLYESGLGVTQDYWQARQWYEKGATAGSNVAMAGLGELYYFGRGVLQDYVQASQWFEYAATAGNASAMTSLGTLYESGRGVKQDYARARVWYENAAAAGNASAMYRLGSLYEHGQGVSQDYSKACLWYQNGAAAGDADAMNNLGSCYYYGHGVRQDYSQARLWYERAAAGGSAAGMFGLGFLYESGLGVSRDYGKARQLYERAVSAGLAEAAARLKSLPN